MYTTSRLAACKLVCEVSGVERLVGDFEFFRVGCELSLGAIFWEVSPNGG